MISSNNCFPDDFWENSFSVNESSPTKKDDNPPPPPLKGETIGKNSHLQAEEKTKK